MEQSPRSNEREASPKTYYTKKLRKLVGEQHPSIQINDSAYTVASELLGQAYERYGRVNTSEYKAYHNDTHGYDVIDRSLKILAVFDASVPEKIHLHDYELLLIAAAGHDSWFNKDRDSELSDEEASARLTAELMKQFGYPELDTVKVNNAIIATTTEHSEHGIVQSRLHERTPSPITLALAMGDINATTMEGASRIISDIPTLLAETQKLELNASLPLKITQLLLLQQSFASDRLNTIHDDLRHFFNEDETRAIQTELRNNYRKRGRELLSLTEYISHHSEEIQAKLHELLTTPTTVGTYSIIELVQGALKHILTSRTHKS